jgi:hypothetical protein
LLTEAQHIAFLLQCLDRPGSGLAHATHRFGGLDTQFDKEARADRTGSTQAAPAVHHHAPTCTQVPQ